MYAHDLKCPTDSGRPQYVGICDRCGEKRYDRDLVFQFQYSGQALVNRRIRVCRDRCLDTPSEFLKPPIIGPEPVPPKDPRPAHYAAQNQGGTPAPTFQQIVDYVEFP